jgi:hypothetical protein
MAKELYIDIKGSTGSGKSTLVYLFYNFLKEKGFKIKIKPNGDFETFREFKEVMSNNLDEKLSDISRRTIIYIEEKRIASFFEDEDESNLPTSVNDEQEVGERPLEERPTEQPQVEEQPQTEIPQIKTKKKVTPLDMWVPSYPDPYQTPSPTVTDSNW